MKLLSSIYLLVVFVFGTNRVVSQIDIGSIDNFSIYTSLGIASNTATSNINGDIGSDSGDVTGFGGLSTVNGDIHNANSVTEQAKLDLNAAVVQINNTTTTATHIGIFGNGETLFSGVYSHAAAASLNGTLTLDGQGDPNAQFIFKIGGAFSTTAGATVVLINCASPSNIFWLSFGAISMGASTIISGNLISHPGAVSVGASVNIDGRILSTSGAISVNSTSIVINRPLTNYWTGESDSDWNNAGNWTCGIPSDFNNFIDIIPIITTTYPIIGAEPGSSGSTENIEIQSGASLTINNNNLRITTILTLNGIIKLKGESQLLQDTGSVFDATSTGAIEIDQQGTGNSFSYNYWSSPVNSREMAFTIGEVLRDSTDPNNIINIDFDSNYNHADGAASSPIKVSTYWVYKLVSSSLGYNEWESIVNTSEIKTGQGYTMKGSNTNEVEQNYTFVGKPNNGNIELLIDANNNYLVGNPYPSALDAYKFILDNLPSSGSPSMTGTLYFWEHYGGDTHLADYQEGGYGAYSIAGGVSASFISGSSVKGAPKQYIPVGQAFFVVGDADGGQIQFNNSQRVFARESSGNSVFMRPNTSEVSTNNDQRPKFRIGFDAPKISHRQVLLTLDNKTTDAVDWGYDSEMYEVFDDDMYWVLNDKKYVIQATNNFNIEKEIPLGIRTLEGGLVSIKVDELENAEDYTNLYIKDNLTGEIHDITNQEFSINLEAGEYQNRFFLVFQPTLNIIEEETPLDGIQIYMNNSISKLQLSGIVDTEVLNVSLFNYLGQQVKTWSINPDEHTLSLPIELDSGVYIVTVETTRGKENKKIIIN